jgi:hypothetical protein
MSTTEVTPVPAEESTESTAHLTVSSTVYRTYGVFDETGKAKGVKNANPSVLSETQTKKNWEEAEKAGATVLNENQYKFYTLTDVAGFETLIPSKEQQLYIIQKGIDAVQTAAANAFQTELKEKKAKEDPDEYEYNGDTIDLREALNTPPKRKNLSDEEKFMKALSVLNQDKVMAMLEQYKRNLEAQASGS